MKLLGIKSKSSTALRRVAGFSLSELLVVVAIISVLIAMLMPGLAKVKAAGRQAACMNNLRQITAAMILYSADNNGKFPPYCFDGSSFPEALIGNGYLTSKLKSSQPGSRAKSNANVFTCPDYDLGRWTANYPAYFNTYASNQYIVGAYDSTSQKWASNTEPILASRIPNPSVAILLSDGVYQESPTYVYRNMGSDGGREIGRYYVMGQYGAVLKWAHGGAALGAFVDGHCETRRQSQPLLGWDTTRVEYFKNTKPQ